MQIKPPTTKKAFTLLETIIVMAIMSILIGIIFFGGRTLRTRAKEVQVKSDIRSLTLSLLNYSSAKKGKFPISNRSNNLPEGRCYEFLRPTDLTTDPLDTVSGHWDDSEKKTKSFTTYELIKSGVITTMPTNPFYKDEPVTDLNKYYLYCSNGQNYQVLSRLMTKANYIFDGTEQNKVEEKPIQKPIVTFQAKINPITTLSGVGNLTDAQANPLIASAGTSFNLSWDTRKNGDRTAVFCRADGGGSDWSGSNPSFTDDQMPYDDVAFRDSYSNEPLKLTAMGTQQTYSLTCYGLGDILDQVSAVTSYITVSPTAISPTTPVVSLIVNGSDAYSTYYTGSQISIPLVWQAENADSCTKTSKLADNNWDKTAESITTNPYTETHYLNLTDKGIYTYSLKCKNSTSNTETDPQTVTITITDPPSDPTVWIKANGSSGTVNSPSGFATISWESANTVACSASRTPSDWQWTGSIIGIDKGSKLYGPLGQGTYNYKITCTGLDSTKTATDTVTVVVDRSGPYLDLLANGENGPIEVYTQSDIDISWYSGNLINCNASGSWSGPKSTTGGSEPKTLNTTGTYTYTMTCFTGSGNITDSVVVNVVNVPTPVITLQISPFEADAYQTGTLMSISRNIKLKWTVKDAIECDTSGFNWDNFDQPRQVRPNIGSASGDSGRIGPIPGPSPNNYVLTCRNLVNTSPKTATVTAIYDPTPTVGLGYDGIKARDIEKYVGNVAPKLRWQASVSATSCKASGSWSGDKAVSDSESTPALTTAGLFTYTMTCKNYTGILSAPSTVTMTVKNVPTPKVSLSVSKYDETNFVPGSILIAQDGNIKLKWQIEDAMLCNATGYQWTNGIAVNKDGTTTGLSDIIGPLSGTSPYNYKLSCKDYIDSVPTTDSAVIVNLDPKPSVTLFFDGVTEADSATGIGQFVGATPTLVWQASASATLCTASNNASVATWNGTKTTGSSQSVGPLNSAGTYIFSLTCQNSSGLKSDPKSIMANVTAVPIPTVDISADPIEIPTFGDTTLSWEAKNALYCDTNWDGNRLNAPNSTDPIKVTNDVEGPLSKGDHVYKVTCQPYKPGPDAAIDEVTVKASDIISSVSLIHNGSGDDFAAFVGDSPQLSWNPLNATSCTASSTQNDWTGTKSTSYTTESISPFTSSGIFIYTISCKSATNNEAVDNITITVSPALPLSVDIKASTDGLIFVDNSITVIKGASGQLKYNVENAIECTKQNGWTGTIDNIVAKAQFLTGQETTGTINANKTYTLQCTGYDLIPKYDSVSVNAASGQPTVKLMFGGFEPASDGSPFSVYVGSQTYDLTWSPTNSTNCTATSSQYDWTGNKSPAGSTDQVGPYSSAGTYTYTIRCTNYDLFATASLSVKVLNPPAAKVDLQIKGSGEYKQDRVGIALGSFATILWEVSNVAGCQKTGSWDDTTGIGHFGPPPSPHATTGEEISDQFNNSWDNRTYDLICTDFLGGTKTDSVNAYTGDTTPSVDLYWGTVYNPTTDNWDRLKDITINARTSRGISWYSQNTVSCNAVSTLNVWSGQKIISGGVGEDIYFKDPGNYSLTLTCIGKNNQAISSTVTAKVTAPLAFVDLLASKNYDGPFMEHNESNPLKLSYGEQFSLEWVMENMTDCYGWSSNVTAANGREQLTAQPDFPGLIRYEIYCYDSAGNTYSSQAYIEVTGTCGSVHNIKTDPSTTSVKLTWTSKSWTGLIYYKKHTDTAYKFTNYYNVEHMYDNSTEMSQYLEIGDLEPDTDYDFYIDSVDCSLIQTFKTQSNLSYCVANKFFTTMSSATFQWDGSRTSSVSGRNPNTVEVKLNQVTDLDLTGVNKCSKYRVAEVKVDYYLSKNQYISYDYQGTTYQDRTIVSRGVMPSAAKMTDWNGTAIIPGSVKIIPGIHDAYDQYVAITAILLQDGRLFQYPVATTNQGDNHGTPEGGLWVNNGGLTGDNFRNIAPGAGFYVNFNEQFYVADDFRSIYRVSTYVGTYPPAPFYGGAAIRVAYCLHPGVGCMDVPDNPGRYSDAEAYWYMWDPYVASDASPPPYNLVPNGKFITGASLTNKFGSWYWYSQWASNSTVWQFPCAGVTDGGSYCGRAPTTSSIIGDDGKVYYRYYLPSATHTSNPNSTFDLDPKYINGYIPAAEG